VSIRIQQLSGDSIEVNQGSLYPALHRLEHSGWIASEWGESENNRKAKFYSLTRAGRGRLQSETARWDTLTSAVALVLRAKEA
jgi:transcriptional regulator